MIFKIIWFGAFALIGLWLWQDISSIPLSQLTLKMIASNILAFLSFYYGATVFWDE